MKRSLKLILITALAVLGSTATAIAASAPWVGSPGSSFSPATGVVTLVNTGTGTSFESSNLDVPVSNGDTISFQWRSTDVACAGGVPRVFIQGGAYNTFDQDPAGPGACGTAPDGEGWRTVTGVVSGIADGTAGHTGIVNDNPADPGTIQARHLLIDGVAVLPPTAPTSKSACKNGGWRLGNYKNQGQCVSHFAKMNSKAKSGTKAKILAPVTTAAPVNSNAKANPRDAGNSGTAKGHGKTK